MAVPGREVKTAPALAVVDWIMEFKRNGHRKELRAFLNFGFKDENVREFATRNNLLPVTLSVTRPCMSSVSRSLSPLERASDLRVRAVCVTGDLLTQILRS
ncbi:hypothetical protein [Streptomyces sp. NBC_00347]|uniref:hypothetical protein n=1 Tax=Streptomyces sp. NBC_00347 TaxID=2975721 RepID=UPI0022569B30|nr:hypothetical protein [Streptomyces sp. NBC_00347]MCX5126763.1 hypothetical protein [Streptomyces sp. NBC_00347]